MTPADLSGRCGRSAGAPRRRRSSATTRPRRAHSSRRTSGRCASPSSAKRTGLLTGYYEPIVDGSRFPNPEFSAPLYRRPRDLMVDGARRRAKRRRCRNRRERSAASTPRSELEPYLDRGAIEDGALDGQHLEISWIKDPLEAMTIQIQGSARVRPRRRHDAAASTTMRTTAIPTRRSDAS